MTFEDWKKQQSQAAEDAGVPVSPLVLDWNQYLLACHRAGVYPRTPEGNINNCALANGALAADCQMCAGRCPDFARLYAQLPGSLAPVSLSESDGGVSARHSSDSVEYFSPYDVVGAVSRTLGGVDLDPASCARANEYIEAHRYFTTSSDGLRQEWSGTVFLNPPGGVCDATGRPVYPKTKRRESCIVTGACGLPPGHRHPGPLVGSAKFWWQKLAREWASGRVRAAVFLGFSLELLCSSQEEPADTSELTPLDCVLCIPAGRLRYLVEDGRGELVPLVQPPHASFLAYLGGEAALFREAFGPIGRVLVGHHDARSEWVP